MNKISEILKTLHDPLHDFETVKPKKKYSEPKIYTGGVTVSRWNKLKKSDQQKAISKKWYVYYSYRNPETGKLQRQDNIHGGVNWYKTREERMEILETYRRNLSRLLKQGYSPYQETGNTDNIKSVEQAIFFDS